MRICCLNVDDNFILFHIKHTAFKFNVRSNNYKKLGIFCFDQWYKPRIQYHTIIGTYYIILLT